MKASRWGCALLLLSTAGAAQAGGNVVASVGMRSLGYEAWEMADIDQQPLLGVLADFQISDLPLHVAIGAQVSAKESDETGSDVTGSVADFSVGLKVMPGSGLFRPYIGAGVASVGVAIETDWDDDDEQSFGYYGGVGTLLRMGAHFTLGLDLRWVGGTDGELLGEDGDADSFIASVLVGYGWGK